MKGTAGYYICRLFTPTGEQYGLGEANQTTYGEKPQIVKNLDYVKNKYVDENGRIEGEDYVVDGVHYLNADIIEGRMHKTDLQPWDLTRIPYSVYWKDTLIDEVYKIMLDKIPTPTSAG